MARGHVNLLDHGGIVARRDEQMIADGPHAFAPGSGKADGDETLLAGLAKRRKNVRRLARRRVSEQHVAALTGREWVCFLDRTLGGEAFMRGPGALLGRLAYQDGLRVKDVPHPDLRELLRLSRRWIRRHHADI